MEVSIHKKFFTIILLISLLGAAFSVYAQDTNAWEKTSTIQEDLLYQSKNPEEPLKTFTLLPKKLIALLANAPIGREGLKNSKTYLDFPDARGYFVTFKIAKIFNMQIGLQKKYPSINTYIGEAINNPTKKLYFSISPHTGIYVMITANDQTFSYIIPTKTKNTYTVYRGSDIQRMPRSKMECTLIENQLLKERKNTFLNASANVAKKPKVEQTLKTFRLALGVTGAMSEEILNELNIPKSTNPVEKKAIVLSWINEVLLKVNSIYNRDVGINFELIANNDTLIFLDPKTDQLSHLDVDESINHFPEILKTKIEQNDYDLGHLIHYGGGGIAALWSLCSEEKGTAATGMQYAPDPYVGTLSHEIGHQLGAEHSFNNCESLNENRHPASAVETGSGNTIMGYADLCESTNVIGGEQMFFHTKSIAEIRAVTTLLNNCGNTVNTENTLPKANAGPDQVIPKDTPFVLEGIGSDDEQNSLTYTWSQMDTEFTTAPPQNNSPIGPMFRWLPPSPSPNRYFPNLQTVNQGVLANTWEVLPSVKRILNFTFTVRDNDLRGGGIATDNKVITVTDEAGPFQITSQNKAADFWYIGTQQQIHWDVANTDKGAVNTPLVDILFSTDGGTHFSYELAKAVPNSGVYEFSVPQEIETIKGRIMVRGNNQLFFDINNVPLAIRKADFIIDVPSNEKSKTVCLDETTQVSYTLSFKTLNDFNENVQFSIEGLEGVTAEFTPESNSEDTTVTLKIDYLNNLKSRENNFIVKATTASGKVTANQLTLWISETLNRSPKLISPYDTQKNSPLPLVLEWQNDSKATGYLLEITKDKNFKTAISQNYSKQNKYEVNQLDFNSQYYWRVKAINSCGESPYSETFSFTTQSDNRTFIPDDHFEAVLIGLGYDTTMDDYVVTEAIKNIKVLDLSYSKIKDLTGIEAFEMLYQLKANNNEIEVANFSENNNLTALNLKNNHLKQIQLAPNSKINFLWLNSNNLSTIDLSSYVELKNLNVSDNELTNLELKNNKKLNELNILNNKITEIDLQENTELSLFFANSNPLKKITLGENSTLKNLALSNTLVTYLDLSRNTQLTSVELNNTQLNFLSLKNGNNPLLRTVDLENNPYLVCVEVDDATKAEAADGIYSNWKKGAITTYAESCDTFDSDQDGIKNPTDFCPFSEAGEIVDFNGCSNNQLDSDQDGVINADDLCTETPKDAAVDSSGCPLNSVDSDDDGVMDHLDQFNNTPKGATVDVLGGLVLPANNFTISGYTPSCPNTANGYIKINNASPYYFDITVSSENYQQEFERVLVNDDYEISNLLPGNYTLNFHFSDQLGSAINGYTVVIGESVPLTASKLDINQKTSKIQYTASGSKNYSIFINGNFQKKVQFSTIEPNTLGFYLYPGENQIEIKGDQSCQISFKEKIFLQKNFSIYPNPTADWIYVEGAKGILRIFSTTGGILFEKQAEPQMKIDISSFPTGIYLISATNLEEKIEFKYIVKK